MNHNEYTAGAVGACEAWQALTPTMSEVRNVRAVVTIHSSAVVDNCTNNQGGHKQAQGKQKCACVLRVAVTGRAVESIESSGAVARVAGLLVDTCAVSTTGIAIAIAIAIDSTVVDLDIAQGASPASLALTAA